MAVLSFRNFTGLTDGERDLILAWRNTDRVRLRMTNRDLLSREEHFRFIDSLASRTDRAYYLFSVDGEPAGVLDFVRIDAVSRSCEPGAYIGDERFLGYGFPLYHCALAHAFDDLGCVVVKGTVRKDNPASSAILRRICPVADSVTAIVLCDLLAQRFGTDYLAKGREGSCSTV